MIPKIIHYCWFSTEFSEEAKRCIETWHQLIKTNGSLDMITNTERITERMKKDGFIANGKEQDYKDLHVFPTEYFCPRQTTVEYLKTGNTYCDHLGACDWGKKKNIKTVILSLFSPKMKIRIIKLKRRILG